MSENPIAQLLFMDALSGEIVPADTMNEGINTLGRLAFASLMWGQYAERSNIPELTMRYRPRWTNAVVMRSTWDTQNPSAVLKKIVLANYSNNSIKIVSDATDRSLRIWTNEDASQLGLVLGDSLDNTKRVVTEAAQAFFEASR